MKHEIEIPDLPEGWEAVAYRFPLENKDYVFVSNQIILCVWPTRSKHIIVRKKQPRRIVLEETNEVNKMYVSGLYETQMLMNGEFRLHNQMKYWKIVEDNK